MIKHSDELRNGKTMNMRPRYFNLVDYVEEYLNALASWPKNPELRTFCQLNRIVNTVVNKRCRYDSEGNAVATFELALKFDQSVKNLLPIEGTALEWLENYFGATFSGFKSDPYDEGGGYIYYTMHEPSVERLEQMEPRFPYGLRWTGGEWVA